MPNPYNPMNFYPATYTPMTNYFPQQQPMQQSYIQQNQGPKIMEWVEGEVGAKAYQMPQGWPANSPIPLWDSTDTVIYLKSWGPMGIPNPIQRIHYTLPEQQSPLLMSGAQSSVSADMSDYVKKSDLEQMRKELQDTINAMSHAPNNQNGSNMNRGGNRNG